jgi:hypothetical protein
LIQYLEAISCDLEKTLILTLVLEIKPYGKTQNHFEKSKANN